MDYILTFDDGSEALAHYGVKGMKWGVWNAETAARYGRGSFSTTRGVRQNVRDLNRLDQRRIVERGYARRNQGKALRLLTKSTKALAKGKTKKATRLSEKSDKYLDEAERHARAAIGIANTQKGLYDKVVAAGYNVRTKDINRNTSATGQVAVQGALFGSLNVAANRDTERGVSYSINGKELKNQVAYNKAKNSYDLAVKYNGSNSYAAKGETPRLKEAEFRKAASKGDVMGMAAARQDYASAINDPKTRNGVPIRVASSQKRAERYIAKRDRKREKTLSKMDRAIHEAENRTRSQVSVHEYTPSESKRINAYVNKEASAARKAGVKVDDEYRELLRSEAEDKLGIR